VCVWVVGGLTLIDIFIDSEGILGWSVNNIFAKDQVQLESSSSSCSVACQHNTIFKCYQFYCCFYPHFLGRLRYKHS
jgi:hypothetical protein